MSPHVVVVGGGISGLAAAYRLRRLLGPSARLTLIEQSGTLGGKLRTVPLAGQPHDVGAEAFLVRRPEARALVEELGLGDALVHPAAVPAQLRFAGRFAPLPPRTLLGVPAAADGLDRVLSAAGLAAVRTEPDTPLDWSTADVAVGPLVARRLGPEVADRLVDPLLGGVYAGRADTLGLRPTMPALAAALDGIAAAGGPVSLRAAAAAAWNPGGAAGTPVFGALRGGMTTLVDALVSAAAVEARLGVTVRAIAPVPGAVRRWRVEFGPVPSPEFLECDAVLLAVPPPALRRLLASLQGATTAAANGAEVAFSAIGADDGTGAATAAGAVAGAVAVGAEASAAIGAAAAAAAGIEVASSVIVSLALPSGVPLPASSGVLVAAGEPLRAKAFTYTGVKWPHTGQPVLRASLGRHGEEQTIQADDATLVAAVRADLAELTGITAEPVDAVVTRWGGGLPQYAVGHLDRVAAIEAGARSLPGLAVAGAALHGIGIPACIATADAAATRLATHLRQRATTG